MLFYAFLSRVYHCIRSHLSHLIPSAWSPSRLWMPKRSSASRSTNSADADWHKKGANKDATKMQTETQLTLLLLLLPVVFLILLVVGVMSPRCNKPAFDPGDFFRCRNAWCCTCTVDSSTQLSMSGPLDAGKAPFLPKTRSYMLSYVFLKEWSKSTLLRNGSSLKICCDDTLGPYEFKLTLSGKGTRVFHSPRCLICSKAAENVWRHWWKLGDAWTFKSGKEEAEATTRDWKGVMFDEVCTATSDIANYIKLHQIIRRKVMCLSVCQFVPVSLCSFHPKILPSEVLCLASKVTSLIMGLPRSKCWHSGTVRWICQQLKRQKSHCFLGQLQSSPCF